MAEYIAKKPVWLSNECFMLQEGEKVNLELDKVPDALEPVKGTSSGSAKGSKSSPSSKEQSGDGLT